VSTLTAVLPLVRHLVNVQTETASSMSLIAEAVAHKDLEGDRQVFPPKHLLQAAAGILFLEKNMIFTRNL
jgi:hypothetical protein